MKDNTYYYFAVSDLETAALLDKIPRSKIISSAEAQEKFLKAYLEYAVDFPDVKLMHSHSIKFIMNGVSKYTDLFDPYYRRMIELGDCYFNLRYPSTDFFEATEEQADKYYETACKVNAIVESEINRIEKAEKSILIK